MQKRHLCAPPVDKYKLRPRAAGRHCFSLKHTFLHPPHTQHSCSKGEIQAARSLGLARTVRTWRNQECQEMVRFIPETPYKQA